MRFREKVDQVFDWAIARYEVGRYGVISDVDQMVIAELMRVKHELLDALDQRWWVIAWRVVKTAWLVLSDRIWRKGK